jgi:hypothetical protein
VDSKYLDAQGCEWCSTQELFGVELFRAGGVRQHVTRMRTTTKKQVRIVEHASQAS